MPPTSRGLLFLSTIRRHASTSAPYKGTAKASVPKTALKPKHPSQSSRTRASESRPKSNKGNTSSPNPEPSQPSRDGYLRSFFLHSRYRIFRRVILVSPALLLAQLHSPFEIMTANGTSMSPFLNPSSSDGLPTTDRILVQRWHTSSADRDRKTQKEAGLNEEYNTEFQRGQIVVFPTPHHPEKLAVKRIVAVPGDLVQPLPGYAGDDRPVVVPWNHVWVEGDVGKRSESTDSNWYGPISQNMVSGEVKAVLTSWWRWSWIDWKDHVWPAREQGRVEENVIMEAAVDPDAVNYSSGWRNGSIALVLERIKRQPEQVLHAFVNDPKIRQESRRLYNNALYVADVATSEQEKSLAKDLVEEMEDVYGREALVFGIRMRRQPRDRGELPAVGNSKIGEQATKDQTASEAERWLKKQGWELERNADGTVKTPSVTSY